MLYIFLRVKNVARILGGLEDMCIRIRFSFGATLFKEDGEETQGFTTGLPFIGQHRRFERKLSTFGKLESGPDLNTSISISPTRLNSLAHLQDGCSTDTI